MKAILIGKKNKFLIQKLKQLKDLSLVKILSPGQEALDYLKNNNVDLILTDKENALLFNELVKEPSKEAQDYIISKSRKKIEKIFIKDIKYFKAEDKYIIAFYDNKSSLIDESLDKLEQKYNNSFTRIHRKYLVSIDSIIKLDKIEHNKNYIILKDTTEKLPISRRKLSTIRKILRGKNYEKN